MSTILTDRNMSHRALPNEVTGYPFDRGQSWWSVILPESSKNLIINPSFEAWTVTEYTATDWSADSYEEFPAIMPTAGRRCAMLTMGVAEANLEYDDGLVVTAGESYTFSLDVYFAQIGVVAQIEIRDSSTVMARKVYTATQPGWQRLDVSYKAATSGTRQVRLVSPTDNPSGTVIYTDAWQFEEKPYPTTYLDGDRIGLGDTRPNESYYWLGIPHRSQSVRRETAGNGGKLVSWSNDIGFLTTSVIGMEMAPIAVDTIEMATGREITRSSRGAARPFTITGRIFGNNYRDTIARQARLIELLRPNNSLKGEGMILRYQYVNERGTLVGDPLDIRCIYSSGFEGSITNFYQANIGLQFRASEPYPGSPYDSSAELDLYKTLTGNFVIFKDEDGDYINLGTGASNNFPLRVGFLRDGSPAAFGAFTTLAGDSVSNAAAWDGANWVQLGSLGGATASDVIDGYLTGYPLTISTTAGAVLEYDEDTDTWNQLGASFLGGVNAIARDPEGNIWVAGEFDTDVGPTTTFNNVAKWNVQTEAWETLGTGLTDPGGLNPDLNALTVLADDDGYVYFGGWFEQGNDTIGTTLANSAIRWNPDTEHWEPMGYGFNAAPNQFIRGSDGYIYATGTFDQDGTETYDLRGFARWNGYQWEEVFPLLRRDGTYGADGMRMDENGIFWFFAYVTDPADDLFDVPSLGYVGTFGYKDGVFFPSIGSVSVTHMAIGPGDRTIYAVRPVDGADDYTVPALNLIQYDGEADAPVALHVLGECSPVMCVNLSVKDGLYFRADLALGAEEEMVARADTRQSMVYSHSRRNLIKFISAGASSLSALYLRPGINRISVFAVNILTEDAKAWLTWKDRFWGIE